MGSSSRFTQRSRVDLPEPDGPITQTTSPWSTWKSMPLSTSLLAEVLVEVAHLDGAPACRGSVMVVTGLSVALLEPGDQLGERQVMIR